MRDPGMHSTQTCGMLVPRVARETIQSELVATIYALALIF